MVRSSQIIRPVCLSQHNETHRDWKMQAEVCGEGFYGPEVFDVPAGIRAWYPLTFHPSARCIVTVMPCFCCAFFVLSCLSSFVLLFNFLA